MTLTTFSKQTANGRIPAIVDRTPRDGKPQQQRVFEGAAILLYLTQRYDPQHKLSYPYDSPEYWETVSFLAWQHGGLGPMQVCIYLVFKQQCIFLTGSNRVKQIISKFMHQKRYPMASRDT